jgi:ATP-dependent DNA helicase HFM1/MER3
MKAGEKSLYKEINKSIGIRYPVTVDIALAAHKVSLIIQSELGGVEYPPEESYLKHKSQYQIDKGIIFTHIQRLIRCIVDCYVHKKDSVSTLNGLELARSFAAKVWDDSPLQLRQIPNLGSVAVKKLVNAGIQSLENLEETEASRIDIILSRNAPFGNKILSCVRDMPKLRVSLSSTRGMVFRFESHVDETC